MKIVLTRDLDDLGFEGDVVDVAKGYARNYLIPKGFGLEASRQNIQRMQMQKKKIEARRVKAKEDAERVREKLGDVVITLSQKVGEEGKLYGSVTTMDIANELERQGISIDRRKIGLDKPIKTLGEFDVPIKLYPKVTGSIKVIVVSEG
jgi:large subunit ribosomal protein L9